MQVVQPHAGGPVHSQELRPLARAARSLTVLGARTAAATAMSTICQQGMSPVTMVCTWGGGCTVPP
jgi:hypothetical protein